MTSLAPPEQWHVWITRRSCFSIAYRRNSFTLGYEGGDGVTYAPDGRLHKNTQSATMLVGHLLIHVFGTRIGWTFSFQDTSVGRAIIPSIPTSATPLGHQRERWIKPKSTELHTRSIATRTRCPGGLDHRHMHLYPAPRRHSPEVHHGRPPAPPIPYSAQKLPHRLRNLGANRLLPSCTWRRPRHAHRGLLHDLSRRRLLRPAAASPAHCLSERASGFRAPRQGKVSQILRCINERSSPTSNPAATAGSRTKTTRRSAS